MKKIKLFSILALLLMATTGAVAQTETLLTTITATAKEQASYSTANVATVSFSYTAYGSSAYLANWGWWGYGWSATVNAAEGYTITKCIFYDDANRTATDSEAPFVVETTEEDKTPRINGTPIDGSNYQSKGIKKIEVYGYENPTTVNVTGITLSQTEAAVTIGGETLTLTATVAPDDATDKTVTWTSSDPTVATVANGVVTAVAAGTATITAIATNGTPDDTTDDFSATCDVTVSAPAPANEDITANEDPENTGVYYSTFFDSSVKYALPAGVEAYVASVSSDALNLTKIAGEGQTIPANNAVILKSTVANFTLVVSDADPVSFTATNRLHGVDADTEIATVVTGTCYVLSGNSTDGVGFFVYQAPNQLKAHKAYIDLNGSGLAQAPRRLRFVFDGQQTATGVENASSKDGGSEKVLRDGQLVIIRNGVEYNANGQIVK